MSVTKKEGLFFFLTFLVMSLTNSTALYLNKRLKGCANGIIPVLIATFVATILILVLYKAMDVAHCGEHFLFEVSKPKLCQGGPYMRQGADQKDLREYCDGLLSSPEGRREYAQMNCTQPGYVGRPITFNYTPMSNQNWENTMCDRAPTAKEELCNKTICTNQNSEPCVM